MFFEDYNTAEQVWQYIGTKYYKVSLGEIENRLARRRKMIRIHYILHGRVQNVGFRYRAARLARGLRMTGYARNLPDGTVEMELQGYEADFGYFFKCIDEDSYIRIDRTEAERMEVVKDETGFSCG